MTRLREMSAAGMYKDQAADALGMTIAGVQALLYRNVGTTKWPIAVSDDTPAIDDPPAD